MPVAAAAATAVVVAVLVAVVLHPGRAEDCGAHNAGQCSVGRSPNGGHVDVLVKEQPATGLRLRLCCPALLVERLLAVA